MKKVLVIVYYWPPAGGGGVQRWLKFVKYLPQFGWEPIIYAPENADYPTLDATLVKEIPADLKVIKRPIFEVRRLFALLSKLKPKKKPAPTEAGKKKKANIDQLFYLDPKERNFQQNVSIWIRGNIFIPDARMTWVRPSKRFLKKYLKDHPVDAVITSGPPHSMHLIGRFLQKKLSIPWVPDMRDPWTEIEFFDRLMLTFPAERWHRKLEKRTITESTGVVEVGHHWIEGRKEMGVKKIQWIPNGFDAPDFEPIDKTPSPFFMLSHVGTLAADRNPDVFWQAIKELRAENAAFSEKVRIQLIGNTDSTVIDAAKDAGLQDVLIDRGYVDHKQSLTYMCQSQLLLIFINNVAHNAKGRLTGKIFEYLATRRPILIIGPEVGEAVRILNMTGAGHASDFDNLKRTKRILMEHFETFQQTGELKVESQNIDQFSRKNLSKDLASFLTSIIENQQT